MNERKKQTTQFESSFHKEKKESQNKYVLEIQRNHKDIEK